MKQKKLKLKLLEKDNRYEGIYYIDKYKRVWLKENDKYIKPHRFDIYCHICKINNINPKTQIYDDYEYDGLIEDAMIILY